MKVAHLITSLNYGGAERQLLLLAGGLREKGHVVAIGCLQSGGEMLQEFAANQFEVAEFGMKGTWDFGALFRVHRWLRGLQPDVVHTHLFKADVIGGLIAWQLGLPFLSTKRSLDPHLMHLRYRLPARMVARKSGKVAVISKAVQEYFVGIGGFDPVWFELVPIGVKPASNSNRLITKERLRFASIGRLVLEKGHHIIVQAFARLQRIHSNVELLVVGTGPLRQELESLVRELGATNVVRFPGVVPDQEQMYSQVDVVIVGSISEGAGNVVLEAMARSIPVIVTTAGGIPEYFNPEAGLAVPPGDVDAMSRAMEQMVSNPQMRLEKGAAGRKHAGEFSFEHTVEKYLTLYTVMAQRKQ